LAFYQTTKKTDLTFTQKMPSLDSLSLAHAPEFNLYAARHFENLRHFSLYGQPLNDNEPIGVLYGVKSLSFSNLSKEDVMEYASLKPSHLNLRKMNTMLNREDFEAFKQLIELNVYGGELKTTDSLSVLERLEEVTIRNTGLENIEGLTNLNNLTDVGLASNAGLEDISPLKGKKIEELDLSGTSVKDVPREIAENVKYLNIRNTNISSEDIEEVAEDIPKGAYMYAECTEDTHFVMEGKTIRFDCNQSNNVRSAERDRMSSIKNFFEDEFRFNTNNHEIEKEELVELLDDLNMQEAVNYLENIEGNEITTDNFLAAVSLQFNGREIADAIENDFSEDVSEEEKLIKAGNTISLFNEKVIDVDNGGKRAALLSSKEEIAIERHKILDTDFVLETVINAMQTIEYVNDGDGEILRTSEYFADSLGYEITKEPNNDIPGEQFFIDMRNASMDFHSGELNASEYHVQHPKFEESKEKNMENGIVVDVALTTEKDEVEYTILNDDGIVESKLVYNHRGILPEELKHYIGKHIQYTPGEAGMLNADDLITKNTAELEGPIDVIRLVSDGSVKGVDFDNQYQIVDNMLDAVISTGDVYFGENGEVIVKNIENASQGDLLDGDVLYYEDENGAVAAIIDQDGIEKADDEELNK